jgi:hypothetical protein
MSEDRRRVKKMNSVTALTLGDEVAGKDRGSFILRNQTSKSRQNSCLCALSLCPPLRNLVIKSKRGFLNLWC